MYVFNSEFNSLIVVRTIVFCGEVVTTSLFAKCLKLLPWVRFVNLYSVSECHDVCHEDLNAYFAENEVIMGNRKLYKGEHYNVCQVGGLAAQRSSGPAA